MAKDLHQLTYLDDSMTSTAENKNFHVVKLGAYDIIKRLMDYSLSLLIVIILGPFFLLIAILIKIDTTGPVIFSQIRIGRQGKPFVCFKFRSMVHGADQSVYEQFLMDVMHGSSDGPKGQDQNFKLKTGAVDQRVTKVGRWLRVTSMDELPQLFNVLKGDMSLVGPRPDMPLSVQGYSDFERKRLAVVPGITGLWQVSGRANLTVRQMFELDSQYVDSRSLLMDLTILIKTFPAVLRRDGAA